MTAVTPQEAADTRLTALLMEIWRGDVNVTHFSAREIAGGVNTIRISWKIVEPAPDAEPLNTLPKRARRPRSARKLTRRRK